MPNKLSYLLVSLCGFFCFTQNTITAVKGRVSSADLGIPYATIRVINGSEGTVSDADGTYELHLTRFGDLKIQVISQGYRSTIKSLSITEGQTLELNFELLEDVLGLDEIVVSATRNRVERKNTPVVVSTLKSQLLTATQSITLAEGLNYAPGVRVETNCQNCGFTQVRLNGLDGAYTQVLLNSRAVFTSLIGVYGLEQIPTNTIERVEVVRSGGSALYGSNAIAGTVNIITKDPTD